MQFWQTCQKFFNRGLKKILVLLSNLIWQTFHPENQKAILTIIPKTLQPKPQKKEYSGFLQKKVLPRCSSGNVECSFDNLAGNFPSEARKTSSNLLFFFKQKFSPKLFLGNWRLQFWQSCCKLLTRSSKKNNEPVNFLQTIIFYSNVALKM